MGSLSSLEAFRNQQKLQSNNDTCAECTFSTEFQYESYLKLKGSIPEILLPLCVTLSPSTCLSHSGLPGGKFPSIFS